MILGASYGSIHDVRFESNTISSNGGAGLGVDASNDNIENLAFLSNTISYNGAEGIHVQAGANVNGVTLLSNTLRFNRKTRIEVIGYGLHQQYLDDVSLESNVVSSNGDDGIFLRSIQFIDPQRSYISHTQLMFNTVWNNTASGIHVEASRQYSGTDLCDLSISGNSISANRQNGLWLKGGVNANVNSNSFSHNEYGVFFTQYSGFGTTNSKNNIFVNNNIYNNTYGVNITAEATVKAENNYWGSSSGPYHSSLNPEGLGNPVNGNGTNFDFIPFLTGLVAGILE